MKKQENSEQKTLVVEVEDLTVEVSAQQEVKGGNGGIQKLGSKRLILQGDGTYSG